jgi:hypothetical protein
MSSRRIQVARGERGTASVELVAVVPFLLLALAVAAQIVLAGQALWSAGVAARAGARATLVGGDAESVAKGTLPAAMRPRTEVDADGAVTVAVTVPRLLPALPRLQVQASAGLEDGDG